MTINLTMFGQMISFVLFVLFCMKYVWPPLTAAMRERQKMLADGLEKAVQAEKQLEEANDSVALELDAAKKQSAELIAQAHQRASQIVEDAKSQAVDEADRIKEGAQAEIDHEVNRAREGLRARVGELAVEGAQKILESEVTSATHQEMLNKLAAQL
ncbi:MAG: F-type H+-transporting ATPase subunit b [Candidatus Azotimanducaceae bacterium]